MKKYNYYFIVFFCALLLIGCTPKLSEITAPPDNMSMDEVTKINLKTLDLNKLSKADIFEIDGINLNKQDSGYELEYRFPKKPIKIKIVKFQSQDNLTDFWKSWLNVHNLQDRLKNDSAELVLNEKDDNQYSIYAWKKGNWFTYIGVPSETPQSEPLRDKVKELVSSHYLNLAKRDFSQVQ